MKHNEKPIYLFLPIYCSVSNGYHNITCKYMFTVPMYQQARTDIFIADV